MIANALGICNKVLLMSANFSEISVDIQKQTIAT